MTGRNPLPGAAAARSTVALVVRTALARVIAAPVVRSSALAGVAVALGACGGDAPLAGQAVGSPPFLGMAHVDLMDLHLSRGESGVHPHEVLTPPQLQERYAMAGSAGAAWNRWSLYWDMVDRGSGFEWQASDGIVRRDVQAGLRTLAILQGTPPRFATGGSAAAVFPGVGGGSVYRQRAQGAGLVAPQSSPPTGLGAPAFLSGDGSGTDDPARADRVNPANPWAVFVDAAVERYKPGGQLASAEGWRAGTGIAAWEIGNEPNLRHFWSGSASEFARYLLVAAVVIERRDPEATVLHGGIADDRGADAWYRSFLQATKAAGDASGLGPRLGYFFDVAAWHWYTYPQLLFDGPARARRLVSEAGLPPKPVWVTEFGVPIWNEHPGPCWDPHSPWRATTAEQSTYVWQAAALAKAAAVESVFLFQLYDDCGNGPTSYDAFGIVRNQPGNQCWTAPEGRECWAYDPQTAGTPRPAHAAAATASELLGPADVLWRPGPAAGWERVLFYLPPSRRVTVAWATGRASVDASVGATGSEGVLYRLDATGRPSSSVARAESGSYLLPLPGSTNRNNPGNQSSVMGGAPVMLVEEDTLPPFRASLSAPTTAETAALVTVEAADGGTGVGAFRILRADATRGGSPEWSEGPEQQWTGPALGGAVEHEVIAAPGSRVHLAVRVRDRAGNWTGVPGSPSVTVEFGPSAPVTPEPIRASIFLPVTFDRVGLPGHAGSATSPPPTDVGAATATVRAAVTASSTSPPSSPTSDQRPGSQTPPATAFPTDPPHSATPSATGVAASPTHSPPSCTPVVVDVFGPREDPIGAGEWQLRAFDLSGDLVVSSHPLDEAGCVNFEPARLEAIVQSPGYIAYPPQDLGLSRRLFLAVAPNALVNGTFEAGLEGWTPFGAEAPAVDETRPLSGRGVARLAAPSGGGAFISQGVNVGPGQILSLEIMSEICATSVCPGEGGLHVTISDLTSGGPPESVTPDGGLRVPPGAWSHLWYDLAPWAGRRVGLTLRLAAPEGESSRVWIDNVAIGKARP